MKPDPLDDLLAAYARKSLPSCPDDLSAFVRVEIEKRRHQSFWSRLLPILDWKELLTEPRLAASAFACALAVGALLVAATASFRTERRLTRQAIHFEVFTSPSNAPFASLINERSTVHSSQP